MAGVHEGMIGRTPRGGKKSSRLNGKNYQVKGLETFLVLRRQRESAGWKGEGRLIHQGSELR